jgi:predicted Zn-dependent protease with MMP-like domain
MDRDRFNRLALEGVRDLPEPFLEKLSNIDIEVRDWPSPADLRAAGVPPGSTLLGMYHGVPQTRRGQSYGMVLPDRIFIYQRPIERLCRSDDEVRERVRKVVLHEIGHHFGMSEDMLREAGAY